MFFIINSKNSNSDNRKVIRETWANKESLNKYSMDYVFVLGISSNVEENRAIVWEAELFGDIVQANFMDTYGNLSLKTLAAFKWVSLHFKQADVFFKTDDDMWINTMVIKDTLNSKSVEDQSIFGNCFGSGYPHRSPTSKWYTPYRYYPHRWYPSFCLGSAFILKTSTIQMILSSSKKLPFFHIEDVFISGILAENGGINRLLTSDIRLDRKLKLEEQICKGNSTLKAQLVHDKNTMYKLSMRQNSCREPLQW